MHVVFNLVGVQSGKIRSCPLVFVLLVTFAFAMAGRPSLHDDGGQFLFPVAPPDAALVVHLER
jgi:hypothetical protein